MALSLTPQVFTILASLVEERAGLHYGPSDRDLFAEKVSARAIEQGFESLLDYYYFMRYDDGGAEELRRLVDQLVVHETYFFREREQMEWLVEHLIAPRCARGQRLRVLSAACATGEEPLTLAMMLAERGLLDEVRIVAADISERALVKAQCGLFSRRSLRHSGGPAWVTRYLHEAGNQLAIAPELVRAVEWRRCNLVQRGEMVALGRFDAVVCRNVLIYFSDDTALAVLGSLTSILEADGVLLVGVSESLLRFGNTVECVEQGGVFVYRPVPR